MISKQEFSNLTQPPDNERTNSTPSKATRTTRHEHKQEFEAPRGVVSGGGSPTDGGRLAAARWVRWTRAVPYVCRRPLGSCEGDLWMLRAVAASAENCAVGAGRAVLRRFRGSPAGWRVRSLLGRCPARSCVDPARGAAANAHASSTVGEGRERRPRAGGRRLCESYPQWDEFSARWGEILTTFENLRAFFLWKSPQYCPDKKIFFQKKSHNLNF